MVPFVCCRFPEADDTDPILIVRVWVSINNRQELTADPGERVPTMLSVLETVIDSDCEGVGKHQIGKQTIKLVLATPS